MNTLKKAWKYYKLRKVNSLDIVPVRIAEYYKQNDLVIIKVPRFKNPIWSRVINRSNFFRLHLDIIGSKVWELIDGKRTIEEIANLLLDESKDKDEIILQLNHFLKLLFNKNLISLSVKNFE